METKTRNPEFVASIPRADVEIIVGPHVVKWANNWYWCDEDAYLSDTLTLTHMLGQA